MLIAYTASSVNKTNTAQKIDGNVIINSTPSINGERIQYSVVSFQFVMNDVEYTGSGSRAGNVTLA